MGIGLLLVKGFLEKIMVKYGLKVKRQGFFYALHQHFSSENIEVKATV
jgi:hypothetical protein